MKYLIPLALLAGSIAATIYLFQPTAAVVSKMQQQAASALARQITERQLIVQANDTLFDFQDPTFIDNDVLNAWEQAAYGMEWRLAQNGD